MTAMSRDNKNLAEPNSEMVKIQREDERGRKGARMTY